MSLNIKNEEVHAAVRRLADVLGVSQTSAVEIAVRAKLEEFDMDRRRRERAARIDAAVAALQEEFRGVDLMADMADLYDPETGLPR